MSRDINQFFEEKLSEIKCQDDTRAYIVGIFGKYRNAEHDFSQNSITLLFAQARDKHDFLIYQNLGDWIFFANTVLPNHLKFASKDYYDSIARISYYSCYRLINKKWKLFEQLADDFFYLKNEVRNKLSDLHL